MTTFTKNSEDARSAKASDPRSAKASAERQLDDIPTRVEELLEQYNGTLSRRTFLKGSGMLVVSFSAAAVELCIPPARGGSGLYDAWSGLFRMRILLPADLPVGFPAAPPGS